MHVHMHPLRTDTWLSQPARKQGGSMSGSFAHLPRAVLLEDGNLLHIAVRRKYGVQRLHRHRICLILNLHVMGNESKCNDSLHTAHQLPVTSADVVFRNRIECTFACSGQPTQQTAEKQWQEHLNQKDVASSGIGMDGRLHAAAAGQP